MAKQTTKAMYSSSIRPSCLRRAAWIVCCLFCLLFGLTSTTKPIVDAQTETVKRILDIGRSGRRLQRVRDTPRSPCIPLANIGLTCTTFIFDTCILLLQIPTASG